MKKNVIIFGGTGFVGYYLARYLSEKNYQVIIITRKQWLHNKVEDVKNIQYKYWDIDQGKIDADIIQQADYIVNLVGENVAKGRWTKKTKDKIVESRVRSAQLILQFLSHHTHKLKCVINASAIGWYGESETTTFTEDAPPAKNFLGQTCQQWEESISPIKNLGIRLVIFRMGIVLSSRGGFLGEFQRLLHWGIAPVFGKGTQMVSWIHIDDYVQMIVHAFENDSVNGVYNAVAPNPVSQRYIITTMQKVHYFRTIKIFLPKWLVKFLLGEMSQEVLKSCKASAKKIEKTGYTFKFKIIEQALKNLLRKG